MNPADVSVTNNDNDAAGITVSTDLRPGDDRGGRHRRRSRWCCTSQPTANVAVGLSSSDLTEGGVSPTSASRFTAVNWSTPRTVTVTGVDDPVDGRRGRLHDRRPPPRPAAIPALQRSAMPPTSRSRTTTTMRPGSRVNPTAGLVTTEAGGTATFTVVLASQPSAGVTIGLASSDPTEGAAAPATVTFTSANWNVAADRDGDRRGRSVRGRRRSATAS